MNLRQLTELVHVYIGDPAMTRMAPFQAIHYLNTGQNAVARDLLNIDREMIVKRTTIPAVSAQAEYLLPDDLDDVVRVTYASADCHRKAIRDLGSLTTNTRTAGTKGYDQSFYLFYDEDSLGTFGGAGNRLKLGLSPTPNDTTNITIWYVIRPKPFHPLGSYTGIVSTASAGIISPETYGFVADPNVPYAGSATRTGFDDWWNGASLEFITGNLAGVPRIIRDFIEDDAGVYGKLLFNALPQIPAAGDEYTLDQVSILPDLYHDLIAMYAAAVAASSMGKGLGLMERYDREIEGVARRWLRNLDAPVERREPDA